MTIYEKELTIILLMAVLRELKGEVGFNVWLSDRDDADQYRWYIFSIYRGTENWKEKYLGIVVPQLTGKV